MMKKSLLIITIFFSAVSVNAQFVYDYLKAADDYFNKGDYASAAEYYEKYFNVGKNGANPEFKPYTPQSSSKKATPEVSSRETAMYRLAESYRHLNFPSKAEPWYKQIVETNKAAFPLAQFHYAAQLRALAKYAEAEQQFTEFLNSYTTNDDYRKNADRELKNLKFIQAQLNKKDLKYYTIKKAPAEVNSTGANYAPAWLNESTFYFTSTRPEDANAKNKTYVNRIYRALFNEGNVSSIERSAIPQDKEQEQGVVTITPDGNTMFLTRWTSNTNKKSAAIYISSNKDNSWTEPTKLGDDINVPGYNSQQPYVSSDGLFLFFSSDRPGGSGGYDIWFSNLTNGVPGTATNIGSVINTEYDEQAPFYHVPSEQLIFSSNGRTGMGGFDFFGSQSRPGRWGEPYNMGYPVNSVKDDIYFTSRGPKGNILENVMLSSDREAACCLELFYLQKIRPLKQVSGRLVSCNPDKPLKGAVVLVVDTINNVTVMTKEVGVDGSYSFTLEDYRPLTVRAQAPGFIPNSLKAGVPEDMEQEQLKYADLCLMPEPPKVNETFIVENVYYDFDKADLKPESFPALDEIVRMLNFYPGMVIELSAHTDSKGSDSYNMKLSEARAKSVVAYMVSKGIDPNRLVAKGYGESMPIAENTVDGKDNPEGREKNRRTEFKVLKQE